MELSTKAQVELKDLMDRTIYLTDKDLYQDIFDIFKSDLDFFYNVKLNINDQYEAASFHTEKKTLFVNPEENYYYVKKYAYSWMKMLNKEDIEDFAKYSIPLVILHEATHGEQSSCAYEDYSSFPEINHLYRRISELDEWWNIPFRINYLVRADGFVFERNANLNAFREILPIVPEKYHDIFKMEYIYNYLKNYDARGAKLITPARKTLAMIWGKYDIIDEGIPVDTRVIHGLDLNCQEYEQFIYEIDNLGIEGSTYDEIQRRLRR